MRVDIDANAGFCGGVVRAIGCAEKMLAEGKSLFSLGAIVHNEEELLRLEGEGLVTIDAEDLERMGVPADGRNLLIRAHGEPPQVYRRLAELGFAVTDCTCPVVLALQKRIREAYARLQALERPGQLVIFGKVGHPEVLGLVGQVDGDATVVEDISQVRALADSGRLDSGRAVELFSQTTMSPEGYAAVKDFMEGFMDDASLLTVHDTICRQVASRQRELADFARSHDVVVFVTGKASSNGKVLYRLCQSQNARAFNIGGVQDLRAEWFRPGDSVGVSGATSTPRWLLEKVARAIENLQ